jgi:plastocyanin
MTVPMNFRVGACALAAALTLAAPAVRADTYSVLIVEGAYFPPMIFAQPGDTLVFENRSGAAHTVSGPEESWTSGAIAPEGSYALNVTEETPLSFSGAWAEGDMIEGAISFDEQ